MGENADGARCAAHGARHGRRGSVEIEELFALLNQRQETGGEAEGHGPNEEGAGRDGVGASPDQNVRPINEVTSSGMFGLDGPPDVADVEKLRFACDAVGAGADDGRAGPSVGRILGGVEGVATMAVSHTFESRGDEFADSFETSFFARTFPTLFPFGVGDQGAAAGDIVSSRSLNLRIWADIVLRRHGGRFALHHIFAFLVFNMGVRSRNRRVSMLSVARKDFGKVERVARSMTAQRLAAARVELESSGKTTDEGVKELLRSLSLYGHRQPMSREVRLNMRRKIQSLIVGYGVPAIWFTINPNDITNPVKLRLAAYRTRDPGAAEEFLEGLGSAYKRTRLAMSDPMSAAVFFHREMKLFFDHYVKVGEDSMLADIHGEDQAAYRERIIRYVDSVFSEDLDQEGFCAVQAERSVTSDISSLLDNTEQFSAAFDEEANFCAGATQVHTHSPTCVNAWAYLNTSLLYWEVFRRWPYLRRASGAAAIDDTLDESVLRRPGKHATVCLDGYLSKDFGHNDDEESCHRRAAVQHLALFVPWESFLCEETGEINSIWERAREALAPRISCLVDNVQLLRRSAEDAKRDAKQWAASSGDGDSTVAHVEEGETGEAGAEFAATYRSNNIGDATRLIDVVRGAVGTNQVTAKSPELMAMMRQLCRFQQSALCSTAELEAIAIPEQGLRCISMPGRVFSGAALPPQDQVKAIKSQQISASRKGENDPRRTNHSRSPGKRSPSCVAEGDDRLREDDVEMTTADSDETASDAEAGMRVQLGPSTSFFAAGKELSTRLTLNKRQSIAFLIICRQLDLMRQTNRGDAGQLCQFVGGEGGTGKSRIIGALVELFSGKSLSNRLLITATSGTAAAQINGITIHPPAGSLKTKGGRREHSQGP
ncbi:ATP-dependent DNA helicase PIF1 [Hirsutella rhossiliensis]|uniref:ATP-dependent DNA helicase PIF1 n=1 Tax=Hirsutella rhossiliensis TaxID=111463 RepID=A0A9P8N7U8_9HYPO|nr:ATP-dependent DNA helicase PIF1 [Hirsutella rhossiliensis]KAH0968152.1 ATP-dependent DNA helicase PIF1 [Hirsutella rhossiliensis]